MKITCFILLLLAIKSNSAPLDNCPSGCTCDQSNDQVTLVCNSLEFLEKLPLKRYNSITNLVIKNASIGKLEPKLKYLKNVKHLDLSDNEIVLSTIPQLPKLKSLVLRGNNLKNINMSLLPISIKELDISHNYLSQIPKDWSTLKSLKTLHLHKNRIDCDCSNILAYNSIIKSGIVIPIAPMCASPKESEGKSITLLINNCSAGPDIMLDDAVEEGSGYGESDYNENTNEFVPLTDENGEYGESSSTTTDTAETESGSGDDGLPGFIEPCQENCKTPKPLGTEDEKNASDLPSIVDQANILIEDVNSAFKSTSSTEPPNREPVDEPLFVKKTYTPLEGNDKTEKHNYLPVAPSTPSDLDVQGPNAKDENFLPVAGGTPSEENVEGLKSEDDDNYKPVAVVTPSDEDVFEAKKGKDDNYLPVAGAVPSDEDVQEADASKASVAEGQRATIYTISGVIIVIAILGLFICLRKRKNNKNRRQQLKENGRELKPITKPLLDVTKRPEIVRSEQQPLLNGQTVGNGKMNEEKPELNTFKPPVNGNANNDKGNPIQIDPTKQEPTYDEDDSILRRKEMPELLTPRTERVTIRESTIPDSIPKTPLLVQRQRDSDGKIIIVPS